MKNNQFRISKDCDFPGVYIILNLDNGKVYIGSTRNIKRRLTEHEINLRGNKHNNKSMQTDYNSRNNFIGYAITRVELLQNPYYQDSNLRFFEYKAIEKFNADSPEKGYNKRADKKESTEMRRIEWTKRYIDDYFWNKERAENPKRPEDTAYHKSEMERFIKNAMENKL